MKEFRIVRAYLNLFGEGGAEGSATSAGSAPEGSSDNNSGDLINPLTGRKVRGEIKDAYMGKQQKAEPGNADTGAASQNETQSTDRRKAFKDLVNGEYKDIYAEETQKIINNRFKQTKELEASVEKSRPLFEALAQRYGIDASDVEAITAAVNDDTALWEEAADQAGMTVEQYKQFQKLQRDSAELQRVEAERTNERRAQEQLMKWQQESDALKQTFPDFDLQAEAQNEQFLNLLRSGVPVEHAYKVIHFDEINTAVMKNTAAAAVKQHTDNIRARGMRPSENGATSRSAFTVKNDVHALTSKDRAEYVRRSKRGENITFN